MSLTLGYQEVGTTPSDAGAGGTGLALPFVPQGFSATAASEDPFPHGRLLREANRSTAIFQRFLVLLDQSPTSEEAFRRALDLARRLAIPVHGIFGPAGALAERDDPALPASLPTQPRHQPSSQGTGLSATMEEIAQGYAAACAHVNVPWQQSSWDGRSAAALRELTKPTDLLTIGPTLRPELKKELLREALRPDFPALLTCSPTAARVGRVLVVDPVDGAEGRSFLGTALTLCQRLGAQPIVLTVAHSEGAARARQQAARDAAAAYGLDADFDYIVGTDLHTAVTQVAQWRRCPLVVLGRPGRAPWWRWRRASAPQLVDSAESFSVLSLPGTDIAFFSSPRPTPGLPPRSLSTQGPLPVAWDGHRTAGTGA